MSLEDFNRGGKTDGRAPNSERKYTDSEITELYRSGLSTYEIADRALIGQTQVFRIIDKHDVETRSTSNKLSNLKLDDKPLYSYIISVLACDGSVFKSSNNTYIVNLNTIDDKFATHFGKKASEFGFNIRYQEINKKSENRKDQLAAKANHKEFYKHWNELTDKEKVSICTYNDECMIQFLKGAYESEGSIWESPNLVVEISNEKDWVIETILEAASHFGFDFKIKSRKETSSGGEMRKAFISERSEVKRFINLINPCIKSEPR